MSGPPGLGRPPGFQDVSGLTADGSTAVQVPPPPPMTKKFVSLEELEQQLQRHSSEAKLGLEEPPASNTPPLDVYPTNVPHNHDYDGIMTAYDIQYVQRVRNYQLLAMDAKLEDYYYHEYALLKSKDGNRCTDGQSGAAAPLLYMPFLSLPMTCNGIVSSGVPKSLQARPTKLKIEGSLGLVQLTSLRKPKASINVDPVERSHSEAQRASGAEIHRRSRQFLKDQVVLESLYLSLLKIEDICRDDEDSTEIMRDRLARAAPLKDELFRSLLDHIDILSLHEKGHMLFVRCHSLFINDGRKDFSTAAMEQLLLALPSIIPRISDRYRVVLDSNQEFLSDADKSVQSNLERFQESFIRNVLTPLLPVIGETINWTMLFSWIDVVLTISKPAEGASYIRMIDLMLPKIGHVLICVLLSFGELLKSQLSEQAQDSHCMAFKAKINAIFTLLSGNFESLFSSHWKRSSLDEYYLWQFLAFMARNLDEDPCREMVAELRAPILNSAKCSKDNPLAVDNVNLLLHTIGLDASQLQ